MEVFIWLLAVLGSITILVFYIIENILYMKQALQIIGGLVVLTLGLLAFFKLKSKRRG